MAAIVFPVAITQGAQAAIVIVVAENSWKKDDNNTVGKTLPQNINIDYPLPARSIKILETVQNVKKAKEASVSASRQYIYRVEGSAVGPWSTTSSDSEPIRIVYYRETDRDVPSSVEPDGVVKRAVLRRGNPGFSATTEYVSQSSHTENTNRNEPAYVYNADVVSSSLYARAIGPDSDKKKVAFQEISKYGWNKLNAMNVAFCESGYRNGVLNHTSREQSLGLFQINLKAWQKAVPGDTFDEKATWLYTPSNNVRFAYNLWVEQGWQPWLNCRKKLGI